MLYLFTESLTSAIIVGIILVGFIAGWAAEFIMGPSGFGIFGNSIVVMVGITAGLIGLAYLGYRIDDSIIFSMAAGAGGGSGALVLVALLRKL